MNKGLLVPIVRIADIRDDVRSDAELSETQLIRPFPYKLFSLKKSRRMIRLLLLITIALVLSADLKAQNHKKYWTGAKLTWDDFHERTSDKGVSELKYLLGYNTDKEKYGDTTILRTVAFCYMDKTLSWVNPDFKTDQILRYNQVIFDIAELYRRRLQHALDRTNSVLLVENTFRKVYSQCAGEIDEFEHDADGGQNINAISTWEKMIADALRTTRDERMPSFSKTNFGYGMSAGIGGGMFTGSLGDHFSPTFNFVFGFDFAYKSSILFLNATLAGGNVRKEYLSDENWYENQGNHVAILDVSYGYAIIDNANFKLTPFAGLGVTEISHTNSGRSDEVTLLDSNGLFGINADYKIRTRLNLVPGLFDDLREKVETCVRARLYVARANYYPDLNGYSINLAVGICGTGGFLRLNE